MNNYRDVVDLLLEFGADPTAAGNENLLLCAILNGDRELIDIAIEAGGNIQTHGFITAAIHRNHPETVQYLLELGCTIEEFDPSNCTWFRISREMVLLLLDLGVEVPSDVAQLAIAGNW